MGLTGSERRDANIPSTPLRRRWVRLHFVELDRRPEEGAHDSFESAGPSLPAAGRPCHSSGGHRRHDNCHRSRRHGDGTPRSSSPSCPTAAALSPPTSAGHRRGDYGRLAVRRSQPNNPTAVRRIARRVDRWPSAQARGGRLRERHGRLGYQGDHAAHRPARCRHDDRAALGRRVRCRGQLRQAAPDEDVREQHGRRVGHHGRREGAELLPLQRQRRPVASRHRIDRHEEEQVEEGGDHHGRLQLRLCVRRGVHR